MKEVGSDEEDEDDEDEEEESEEEKKTESEEEEDETETETEQDTESETESESEPEVIIFFGHHRWHVWNSLDRQTSHQQVDQVDNENAISKFNPCCGSNIRTGNKRPQEQYYFHIS